MEMPDEPWKLLDRSTAAGRALWSIYGGPPLGQDVGNSYSSANQARFRAAGPRRVTEEPKPVRTSPQKAKVAVPKFRKSAGAKPAPSAAEAMRGRKSQHSIQEQQQEEIAVNVPQPKPARAPLDDREKQRLAHIMAHGHGQPGDDSEDARPARQHGCETSELEHMFESVLAEVDQHKVALQEALDMKSPEATFLKQRLDAALQDLRRIDELLRTA